MVLQQDPPDYTGTCELASLLSGKSESSRPSDHIVRTSGSSFLRELCHSNHRRACYQLPVLVVLAPLVLSHLDLLVLVLLMLCCCCCWLWLCWDVP